MVFKLLQELSICIVVSEVGLKEAFDSGEFDSFDCLSRSIGDDLLMERNWPSSVC